MFTTKTYLILILPPRVLYNTLAFTMLPAVLKYAASPSLVVDQASPCTYTDLVVTSGFSAMRCLRSALIAIDIDDICKRIRKVDTMM